VEGGGARRWGDGVVTVVIEAMVVRWGPSSERTKERGATTPERHKEGKALGIPPVRRAIGPGLFLSATNIRPIAFIFFFFLLFVNFVFITFLIFIINFTQYCSIFSTKNNIKMHKTFYFDMDFF
jgi:hypothetical protein